MFISVLVPNYNNDKFIEKCLNSIIRQTIDKNMYEIIVLDDHSTDDSANILNNINFKNLKKIFGKKNIGLSLVRGELISNISKKTSHIFFLDGDDWVDEKCLEELIKTAKEFPNKIAACGTLKNNKLKSTSRGGRISIINTTQHSKLWPKENLLNIVWPKGIKNEDDYVIPWALNDSEIIVNKEAIYYHRVVPGSLSTIKNKDNAKRIVDLALKNWPLNHRNLSLLHHSVTAEGAGKYYKKQCKLNNIKRPSFIKKIKFIGFKRTFADFWMDILFH